jgi:hypothetical protein
MGSVDDSACQSKTRSTFTTTTGGVMTVEVGAVTGELEAVTRPKERTLEVLVRYAGAKEWYTVEGSPIVLENTAGLSSFKLCELHKRVVRHLTVPGAIVNGNEEPTSLREYSLTIDEG